MGTFYERLTKALSHGWNAFKEREPTPRWFDSYGYGIGSAYRPDRIVFNSGIEKTILSSLYNRLAIDVSSVEYAHVRVDEDGLFRDKIKSGLAYCLNTRANLDQTGKMLIRDIALSLFNDGVAAVVITQSDKDPYTDSSFKIQELRVGKIVQWFPKNVTVSLYNAETGVRTEYLLPKERVAIIENPLYPVMNEPNSTAKRLVSKFSTLDAIDNALSSGKLDIIIQLPYSLKSEAKRAEADKRRKEIEMQLAGSKYGIAYTDAAEHVIQLNRPSENNILSEIEYLTKLLLSQLGFTEGVFNGTATEEEMLNYYNRSVDPVINAICDGLKVAFLTKTAITQGQSVMFFRDPFKLVSAVNMADITDKFTRNEILSSNEVRSRLGYKPSGDPRADMLKNKNLKDSDTQEGQGVVPAENEGEEASQETVKGENSQNGNV